MDSRRRRINPLPPVKDVRRGGWNLWKSPGMWTGTVRPPRDFAAAAAAAWLGLLLIGAVVAGFVLAGIVIGRRELTAGLLHIYGACRVWLRSPAEPLLALASAGPALVFISAALGGVSSLWDTFRARTLVRGFRAVGFQQDPRVAAIARRLGVADRVHTVSDPEPYALTAGFWRPAIFLSTGMTALLEGDELEAVLRHELAHVRCRDPLKVLLGRAVRRALFFLPLVDDLWTRYVIASELAADASVVAAQGRSPLARALVRLLPAGRYAAAGGVPGFGSASDARVSHLLEPGSVSLPSFGRTRLALSAAAFIAVLGAVPLHSPPSFLDVLLRLGLAC